jgi:uncharacterized protein YjcR
LIYWSMSVNKKKPRHSACSVWDVLQNRDWWNCMPLKGITAEKTEIIPTPLHSWKCSNAC